MVAGAEGFVRRQVSTRFRFSLRAVKNSAEGGSIRPFGLKEFVKSKDPVSVLGNDRSHMASHTG